MRQCPRGLVSWSLVANDSATSAHRRLTGDDHGRRRRCTVRSLRSTIRHVVFSYGFLAERRIQRDKRQQLGWPELTAASSFAAAGLRACVPAWFQCTRKLSRGCVGLDVAPRARRRHELEWRCTVAAGATTMVDGGARVWWLARLEDRNELGEEGERRRISQRIRRGHRRARGRTGDGESTATIGGGRGRSRACCRRSGATRAARIRAEDEDDVSGLLGTSEEQGDGCGRCKRRQR